MNDDEINLGFREPDAPYFSGSQKARIWTERWVSEWLFCPNCGHPKLSQFPANRPVADFVCSQCEDQFELKSQKRPFGAKLANGAYSAKMERLASANNPNLLLLNYDLARTSVKDIIVIPKHFFAPEVVEKRNPLKPTARRAGWIGSNILLSKIPQAGRIQIVQNGIIVPRQLVLDRWKRTIFLRDQPVTGRGWLLEVMNCVDFFGDQEFDIDDIYAFERHLSRLYPGNNNVRPKIRQQLQLLREMNYLRFLSRGRYRRISQP